MQNLTGFLCIAVPKESAKRRIMFGQGDSEKPYSNFCGNGLKPYSTIERAKIGRKELLARGIFKKVTLAKISMEIARGREEMEFLRGKRDLVVLMFCEISVRMIGRWTKGAPSIYPLYGAEIEENGFSPYRSFDKVLYSATEAHRQGACPVALATFELEKVNNL